MTQAKWTVPEVRHLDTPQERVESIQVHLEAGTYVIDKTKLAERILSVVMSP